MLFFVVGYSLQDRMVRFVFFICSAVLSCRENGFPFTVRTPIADEEEFSAELDLFQVTWGFFLCREISESPNWK